jgi:hypothetical protein
MWAPAGSSRFRLFLIRMRGTLADHLSLIVPNLDLVGIPDACGEKFSVFARSIIVFTNAALPGNDAIGFVENPKAIQRHDRAPRWRGITPTSGAVPSLGYGVASAPRRPDHIRPWLSES